MKTINYNQVLTPAYVDSESSYNKESQRKRYTKSSGLWNLEVDATTLVENIDLSIKELSHTKWKNRMSININTCPDKYMATIIYQTHCCFPSSENFINAIFEKGISIEEIRMLMINLDHIINKYPSFIIMVNAGFYHSNNEEINSANKNPYIFENKRYLSFAEYFIEKIMKNFEINEDFALLITSKLVEVFVQEYQLIEKRYGLNSSKQKRITLFKR